jgi:hypothetical protein
MRTILLLIAAMLLAVQADAADLPVQGKRPAVQSKPAPAENIHAYGDANPSCQVWTDGCRRCNRTDGAPTCSNIGIACQPGPVKCDAEPKSTR